MDDKRGARELCLPVDGARNQEICNRFIGGVPPKIPQLAELDALTIRELCQLYLNAEWYCNQRPSLEKAYGADATAEICSVMTRSRELFRAAAVDKMRRAGMVRVLSENGQLLRLGHVAMLYSDKDGVENGVAYMVEHGRKGVLWGMVAVQEDVGERLIQEGITWLALEGTGLLVRVRELFSPKTDCFRVELKVLASKDTGAAPVPQDPSPKETKLALASPSGWLTVLRQLPGDGRMDYYLAESDDPFEWNGQTVRYLVIYPSQAGGRLAGGSPVQVNVCFVVDESIVADEYLDTGKLVFTAVAEAKDTSAEPPRPTSFVPPAVCLVPESELVPGPAPASVPTLKPEPVAPTPVYPKAEPVAPTHLNPVPGLTVTPPEHINPASRPEPPRPAHLRPEPETGIMPDYPDSGELPQFTRFEPKAKHMAPPPEYPDSGELPQFARFEPKAKHMAPPPEYPDSGELPQFARFEPKAKPGPVAKPEYPGVRLAALAYPENGPRYSEPATASRPAYRAPAQHLLLPPAYPESGPRYSEPAGASLLRRGRHRAGVSG